MAPLASVANCATKRQHLHWFKIWTSGGATCIATLPWIALLSLSASIELVSSSARVTSVKSANSLGVTDTGTHRSDRRYNGVQYKIVDAIAEKVGIFALSGNYSIFVDLMECFKFNEVNVEAIFEMQKTQESLF